MITFLSSAENVCAFWAATRAFYEMGIFLTFKSVSLARMYLNSRYWLSSFYRSLNLLRLGQLSSRSEWNLKIEEFKALFWWYRSTISESCSFVHFSLTVLIFEKYWRVYCRLSLIKVASTVSKFLQLRPVHILRFFYYFLADGTAFAVWGLFLVPFCPIYSMPRIVVIPVFSSFFAMISWKFTTSFKLSCSLKLRMCILSFWSNIP